MPNPRFSIVIPTRDRPETLRHTLATVLGQPGHDYEVIVADNCSSPATRQIVEELTTPQLRYLRSDDLLPMATNWERGVAASTGDYVTVLGDDDAFLPSTLAVARWLVNATQAQAISWFTHTYWWPGTILHWKDNILVLNYGDEVRTGASRMLLERFYRGEVNYTLTPMIYNALIHRSVIEMARARYGAFFVPPDTPPDIASGILALHLTQSAVYSTRPLTIRGNSGKSNGTAHYARSYGEKQREQFYREERMGLEGIIHKSLVPSPNLSIVVASAKLKCRDAYFPDDPVLKVNLQALVREMVASLNFESESYEENLADARALAAKIGMDIAPSDIPARRPAQRVRSWGLKVGGGDAYAGLTVDCDQAGIHDIAAAARLVEALMPPTENLQTP